MSKVKGPVLELKDSNSTPNALTVPVPSFAELCRDFEVRHFGEGRGYPRPGADGSRDKVLSHGRRCDE